MKSIFTFLALLFCNALFGQTTMNIYQSNGSLLQIPTLSIDSVRFSVVSPPPMMNIYLSNGNVLSFSIYDLDSITYTLPDDAIYISSLTTNTVNNITNNTALSGGYVNNDGGAPVTARGVCWSTIINPTISNNKTINGSGTGSFISNVTGLTPNTSYYLRAYATNSAGTAYGNQVQFTTLIDSIPSDTCIYYPEISGTFTGTHKLNVTPAVIIFLESLVDDTVDIDIASGFKDTITISVHPSDTTIVYAHSTAFNQVFTGVRTGPNKFRIPATTSSSIILFGSMEWKNVTIRTLRDIAIRCDIPNGNTAIIELYISGTVDGSPVDPITVNTTPAVFVRQ